MNLSVKASLLTIAISAVFAPAVSNAGIGQIITSSAMAHCQAFTPGVTNTIRNRVVGSENIGATMAIACAFEVEQATMTEDGVQAVWLTLNNHGATAFSVPCTLAVGPEGAFSYYINKTTIVEPSTPQQVTFSPEDAGSTDLGFKDWLVGLTCSMPKNAIMNDTNVSYEVNAPA